MDAVSIPELFLCITMLFMAGLSLVLIFESLFDFIKNIKERIFK
jgi:hypothetical protein